MKYIAFLRGINVGKNKLILMEDLKKLFVSMGFKNIKTYLRSGNEIFENININDNDNCINYNEDNINNISSKISENIENSFGFWTECILLSEKEIFSLINNNPFFDNTSQDNSEIIGSIGFKEPIESLYITIFKNKIDKNLAEKLVKDSKNNVSDDKFSIYEKEIYLACKNGYHKTKFNNNYFELKLDNIATTRNFKTILKIKDLLI